MGNSELIILIDDNRIDLMISKSLLSKFGYSGEIKEFIQPQLAINWIKENYNSLINRHPLYIFLDINMPLINGFELIEEIEQSLPKLFHHVELYLVTSSNDESDIHKAGQKKFIKEFIQKPLSIEKLNQIIPNSGCY